MREVVADHGAFEAHFAAQHVVQQPAVHVRGHAVDLVVRRHHCLRIAALDRRLERREEHFAQDALGDIGRADIGAALGLAVAGHVLQRREHATLCASGSDSP